MKYYSNVVVKIGDAERFAKTWVERFRRDDGTRVRYRVGVLFPLSVENYLGHFLEKLQKILKKYKKLPQQQRGALRAPLLLAFFCTFSIFFVVFPKNGPGSFPQKAPRTDFIRLVSSKLMLQGGSCRLGRLL